MGTIFLLLGLVGAFVQNWRSAKMLILVGSVLHWGGILASVFVPDIASITVTFGLIHGKLDSLFLYC